MFNVGVIGWRMCIFVDLANVVHRVPLIRFSEMPRPKWTKESSERYWEQRPSRVILRSTNICQLNETRAGHRSERLRKRATRKEEFPRAFRVPTRSTMSKRVFTETANDLTFWAEHRSWAYCTRCASLQSKKLLPAYHKQTNEFQVMYVQRWPISGASPEESSSSPAKSDHG